LRQRICARWGTVQHQTNFFYFLPDFQTITSWHIMVLSIFNCFIISTLVGKLP
jgi:hypothetical protein